MRLTTQASGVIHVQLDIIMRHAKEQQLDVPAPKFAQTSKF